MFKQLTHIIFSCLIVLLLYIFYVSNFVTEEKNLFNVLDRNITRFEDYYLNEKTIDNVIVGSSMAANLRPEFLNADFYNLATEGGNCFSGLYFITKDKCPIKRVFVEINSLFRKEKNNPAEIVLNKYNGLLIKSSKAFRENNKPVHNMVHKLIGIKESINKYRRSNNDKFKIDKGEEVAETLEKSSEAIFRSKLLSMHYSFYKDISDSVIIKSRVDSCFKVLKKIESKGIEVVLIELPADKRLNNSPIAKLIRAYVKANNNKRFEFIGIDLGKEYLTSDYVHLSEIAAKKYAKRLLDHIKIGLND